MDQGEGEGKAQKANVKAIDKGDEACNEKIILKAEGVVVIVIVIGKYGLE